MKGLARISDICSIVLFSDILLIIKDANARTYARILFFEIHNIKHSICILLKIIEGPMLSIITLMHFVLNVF